MQTSLKGINKRALKDAKHRFGGLYRLLNLENLTWAYTQLNKRASSGVDGVSYSDYGQNLKENLQGLVERLKNKSYKAKLIRRVYIPKSATKMRPLGIPAIEDKIVQFATTKILEAIYEADFIETSYGYRPHRGAHDAVKKVNKLAQFGPFNFIVEADIKGFFDNIDHDWLLKMIALRVDDKALIGLIRKWLKAGILDKDMVTHPNTGTPQGGVISPVLANIYLHYALDLWFEKRIQKQSRGACRIIRYADDFVCLFQVKDDASEFYEELSKRLKKFNLEVAPEKTNLLKFSRFCPLQENQTFEFLGFQFCRELTRKGKVTTTNKTAPKKLQKGVANFTEWIKEHRSDKLGNIMATVRRKFMGHYNYYGRIGNAERLGKFNQRCERVLFKWLNRRSQKSSYNWVGFVELMKYFGIPKPRITENNRQREFNFK